MMQNYAILRNFVVEISLQEDIDDDGEKLVNKNGNYSGEFIKSQ